MRNWFSTLAFWRGRSLDIPLSLVLILLYSCIAHAQPGTPANQQAAQLECRR